MDRPRRHSAGRQLPGVVQGVIIVAVVVVGAARTLARLTRTAVRACVAPFARRSRSGEAAVEPVQVTIDDLAHAQSRSERRRIESVLIGSGQLAATGPTPLVPSTADHSWERGATARVLAGDRDDRLLLESRDEEAPVETAWPEVIAEAPLEEQHEANAVDHDAVAPDRVERDELVVVEQGAGVSVGAGATGRSGTSGPGVGDPLPPGGGSWFSSEPDLDERVGSPLGERPALDEGDRWHPADELAHRDVDEHGESMLREALIDWSERFDPYGSGGVAPAWPGPVVEVPPAPGDASDEMPAVDAALHGRPSALDVRRPPAPGVQRAQVLARPARGETPAAPAVLRGTVQRVQIVAPTVPPAMPTVVASVQRAQVQVPLPRRTAAAPAVLGVVQHAQVVRPVAPLEAPAGLTVPASYFEDELVPAPPPVAVGPLPAFPLAPTADPAGQALADTLFATEDDAGVEELAAQAEAEPVLEHQADPEIADALEDGLALPPADGLVATDEQLADVPFAVYADAERAGPAAEAAEESEAEAEAGEADPSAEAEAEAPADAVATPVAAAAPATVMLVQTAQVVAAAAAAPAPTSAPELAAARAVASARPGPRRLEQMLGSKPRADGVLTRPIAVSVVLNAAEAARRGERAMRHRIAAFTGATSTVLPPKEERARASEHAAAVAAGEERSAAEGAASADAHDAPPLSGATPDEVVLADHSAHDPADETPVDDPAAEVLVDDRLAEEVPDEPSPSEEPADRGRADDAPADDVRPDDAPSTASAMEPEPEPERPTSLTDVIAILTAPDEQEDEQHDEEARPTPAGRSTGDWADLRTRSTPPGTGESPESSEPGEAWVPSAPTLARPVSAAPVEPRPRWPFAEHPVDGADPDDRSPEPVTAAAAGPRLQPTLAPRRKNAKRPVVRSAPPSRQPVRAAPPSARGRLVARDTVGYVVLGVLLVTCGLLITAVYLKTQNDAASARAESAAYTPPALPSAAAVARPIVTVLADQGGAASGSPGWTKPLGTAVDATVRTVDAAGGYGAAGGGASDSFEARAARIDASSAVVVLYGGAEANASTATLSAAATAALSAAAEAAPGARLVVVGPVAAGQGGSTSLRDALRAAAAQAGARYVDPVDGGWLDGDGLTTAGGAPTAEGDREIARRMRTVVRPLLAKAAPSPSSSSSR